MIRYFLIALLILGADQLSKKLILFSLAHREQLKVFSWLDIVHIYNRGAAFSLFASNTWANYFFLIFGVCAILFISLWLWKWSHSEPWLHRLALACILGGAGGNIADRLQFGFVIDFISVHYKHWYYPSFNLADAAISLGAVMILLALLRGKTQSTTAFDSSPSTKDDENRS